MSSLRFASRAFSRTRTPAAAAVRLALAAAVIGAPAAYAQTAGGEPATLQEVKIVGTAERGYDAKSASPYWLLRKYGGRVRGAAVAAWLQWGHHLPSEWDRRQQQRHYASANSDSNITPGSPRAVRVSLIAKF